MISHRLWLGLGIELGLGLWLGIVLVLGIEGDPGSGSSAALTAIQLVTHVFIYGVQASMLNH